MRATSRSFAGAVFSVLLAAAPAFADLAPVPPEAPPAKTLTWDDCVALALRQNPDLASALRAADASRAGYYESYNGLLPNLTLQNGYSSSGGTKSKPAYTGSATAAVSLFNAGTIASVRAAKAGLSQSEASARAASSNLRQTLRRAYAQVLAAETTVDVDRQILAMRRRDAQLVTLRYQSGHEYKGNMMNANSQLLQAQASLAQALRDLRTSRRGLDRQLGLDDFEEVAATGTLAAAAPPDLPARLEDFLAARPDVALQQAVVKGAEASVASSESTLFPSLTGTYTRERGSSGTEFPARPYSWSAGATLSYPLFGGGPTSTYYAVKAAKRNLEKSQQDLRAARDAAVLDLETTWSSYAGAVDQVQVQLSLLESARQRNAEADVRYASGLLTFDNWELIVSERVSAEQSAVQAQLNAVIAQAVWEKSLGKALGQ